jgi:dihydrofolate reductase
MRRIIVAEFVSLDGVMEDPGGAEGFEYGGWTFKYPDPKGYEFKGQELWDCDALLLGRTTYEGFAAAWPDMEDEAGFADKMNSMPKVVVSTTLTDPAWNNTTVVPDVEAVAALKQQDGGDILVNGSAQLVHALTEHGLVDEWRLMVFPIVLGSGKRLFGRRRAASSWCRARSSRPARCTSSTGRLRSPRSGALRGKACPLRTKASACRTRSIRPMWQGPA